MIISIIRQCLNSCPPLTALLVNTHFPAGAAPCLWSGAFSHWLGYLEQQGLHHEEATSGGGHMQWLSVAGEAQLACTE